ncbi:RDD family protein [Pedomonas mirosovicensis]|uniref:RDD family protein n=1 Tax=Pedomonas mirosovicensis TaxID=2908641 RepID=UPI002166DB37|nr:RDD family protein [Pedomonas mirosovicensis]MCH8685679.1 RDD family protein [Pedomonas mirosovicensis]
MQNNTTDSLAITDGAPEEQGTVSGLEPADAWQRFWARSFDIYLFTVAGVFLVAQTPQAWLEHEIFTTLVGQIITDLLFLPIALFLDAIVYACFGTTPGKALAGLKLLTTHGDRLTLSQVIRRNLQIYIFGLGLGLPIIMLYCLWQRYSELSGWQFTRYDTALDTRVWSTGSDWRIFLVAVPTIVLHFVSNM